MGLISEILLPDKKTTRIRIIGNAVFACFFAYGVFTNKSVYAVVLMACCVIPLTIDLFRLRKFKTGEVNFSVREIKK